MRKKLAIVVQRYGLEVNGGAEVHARMIAEQLSLKYDVVVLTSQALDYTTWAPHYSVGLSTENNIKIIRFTTYPRQSRKEQEYWGRKIRGRHLLQKTYRWLAKPKWLLSIFPSVDIGVEDGLRWLKAQGPYMPELPAYLRKNEKLYTAFIFVTALYYPSAVGVLAVPKKSILIPTMHDERAIYGEIYQEVMSAPAWLMFNTKAEQSFSENLFPIHSVRKCVVGVGITRMADMLLPDSTIPKKYGVTKPYLIYVGRIDGAKGCDALINFFIRYISETGADLQLIMVGKNFMKPKLHPKILYTGYAEEQVKQQLMLQASVLVIPSLFESLSLVLLESFGCKVPVIANGNSEVLRDHINDSGGGWHYQNYSGFKLAVSEVFNNPLLQSGKGESGYRYVKDKYDWKRIMSVFNEAINSIASSTEHI